MKTIYFIRHAKSSWDDPALSDFDRPLNDKGLADAPKMGKKLQELGINPNVIIASPAVRAYETAEIVKKEIGFFGEIITNRKLYNATAEQITEVIAGLSHDLECVFIVGHNPGLNEIVHDLVGDFVHLGTCSVFGVRFESEKWQDLETSHKETVLFLEKKAF